MLPTLHRPVLPLIPSLNQLRQYALAFVIASALPLRTQSAETAEPQASLSVEVDAFTIPAFSVAAY